MVQAATAATFTATTAAATAPGTATPPRLAVAVAGVGACSLVLTSRDLISYLCQPIMRVAGWGIRYV